MFAGPASDPKSRVAALRVPKGGELTRKQIDDYTALVGRYGAKGLAYIKVNEKAKGRDGLQSPILKFLPDAAIAGVLERTGAVDGDLVFFGADKAHVVNEALGRAAARRSGRDRKLEHRAMEAALGRRLPDVRVGRRAKRLDGDAPSVHRRRAGGDDRPRSEQLRRAGRAARPRLRHAC